MNEKAKSGKVSFANTAFMPQEEQLETAVRHRKISIGVPSDKKNDEKRVALTPESVNLLVDNGHEVIVQKGAGAGANYSDKIVVPLPPELFSSFRNEIISNPKIISIITDSQ